MGSNGSTCAEMVVGKELFQKTCSRLFSYKKKNNGKKNTKQDINRETLICLGKLFGKNTNNLFWLGMKTLD